MILQNLLRDFEFLYSFDNVKGIIQKNNTFANMRFIIPTLVLLMIFGNSCKKDILHEAITTATIPSNIRIDEISKFSGDTLFLCGGIKNEKGEIYRSTDNGLTWQKVYSGQQMLHSLLFFNATVGIAVGDSVEAVKTSDRGRSWNLKVNTSTLYQYYESNMLKIKTFGSSNAVVISDNNRIDGNFYLANQVDDSWETVQGANGLRDVWVFNSDSAYAVGFGILEKIMFSNQEVTILPLIDDYFTGIWFTTNKTGYVCGYEGGIYKTEDGGQHWKSMVSRNGLFNKLRHFNAILFVSDEIGYVAGENGELLKTSNAGKTWKEVSMPTKHVLVSLFYSNQTLYISSDNGTYYTLQD